MRKKFFVVTALVMFSVSMFSTSAYALYCIVSSNPQGNGGFCRPASEGGDACFLSGTGPACWGTGGYEDVPPGIGG